MLMQALAERNAEWRLREDIVANKKHNQGIRYRIELLYRAHEDGRK
jgi:hypothetical protein